LPCSSRTTRRRCLALVQLLIFWLLLSQGFSTPLYADRATDALEVQRNTELWKTHTEKEIKRIEGLRDEALKKAAAAEKTGDDKAKDFELAWAKKFQEMKEDQEKQFKAADAAKMGAALAHAKSISPPELAALKGFDPETTGVCIGGKCHNGAVATAVEASYRGGIKPENVQRVNSMEAATDAGQAMKENGVKTVVHLGHGNAGKVGMGDLTVSADNAKEYGSKFPFNNYVVACKFGSCAEGDAALANLAEGSGPGTWAASSTANQWVDRNQGLQVQVGSEMKVVTNSGGQLQRSAMPVTSAEGAPSPVKMSYQNELATMRPLIQTNPEMFSKPVSTSIDIKPSATTVTRVATTPYSTSPVPVASTRSLTPSPPKVNPVLSEPTMVYNGPVRPASPTRVSASAPVSVSASIPVASSPSVKVTTTSPTLPSNPPPISLTTRASPGVRVASLSGPVRISGSSSGGGSGGSGSLLLPALAFSSVGLAVGVASSSGTSPKPTASTVQTTAQQNLSLPAAIAPPAPAPEVSWSLPSLLSQPVSSWGWVNYLLSVFRFI